MQCLPGRSTSGEDVRLSAISRARRASGGRSSPATNYDGPAGYCELARDKARWKRARCGAGISQASQIARRSGGDGLASDPGGLADIFSASSSCICSPGGLIKPIGKTSDRLGLTRAHCRHALVCAEIEYRPGERTSGRPAEDRKWQP